MVLIKVIKNGFNKVAIERNRTCSFKSNLEGFRLPLPTVINCCQRRDRWSALRYRLGEYDDKENIHFNFNLITGISIIGILFRSSRCRSSIPSYISGWLSSLYFFILHQVSTVSFVMFHMLKAWLQRLFKLPFRVIILANSDNSFHSN